MWCGRWSNVDGVSDLFDGEAHFASHDVVVQAVYGFFLDIDDHSEEDAVDGVVDPVESFGFGWSFLPALLFASGVVIHFASGDLVLLS